MTTREPADLESGGAMRPIRRFTPLHRGCCCVVVTAGLLIAIPLGVLYQRGVRSDLAENWTSWSWWRWRIAPDIKREVLARDWVANRLAASLEVDAVLDDLVSPPGRPIVTRAGRTSGSATSSGAAPTPTRFSSSSSRSTPMGG